MSMVRALVLVVTQVERDAVLGAVQKATDVRPERRTLEHHTVFDLGMVNNCQTLLAQAGEQGGVGPAAMMLTASALLRLCRPDYAILAGICYGLMEDRQQLGDILVSGTVQELDHQRVIDGPGSAPVVFRRGARVASSVTLLDRFNAATISWRRPSAVHFGLTLSANTLVSSRTYRESYKREFPDALGGDMEGAAIYAASFRDNVDWIVVKAISDWGYDKTGDYQQASAANAAEFVVHMLQTCQLPPRAHRAVMTPCA